MMKKSFIGCMMMMLVFCCIGAISFADASVISINDTSDTVSVKYDASNYEDLKVLVKKDALQYVYNIFDNNETFPLQMGSGDYTIGLYQRTEGNKYRMLTSSVLGAQVDPLIVFKQSVQNMNWSKESAAVKFATKLMLNAKTDKEKFDIVYKFMVSSIVYDYQKAASVGTRYIPVIDNTLSEKKGICYDYSSLMASMLRSAGIPAKLAEGKSTYTSVYHAWNEVYLNGKWITIDTTIDAQLITRKIPYKIEKTINEYTVAKFF